MRDRRFDTQFPTPIPPEARKAMLEHIANLAHPETAALAEGIPMRRFWATIHADPDFALALQRARARAECAAAKVLAVCMREGGISKNQLRAAVEYLSRCCDGWSSKTTLTMEVQNGVQRVLDEVGTEMSGSAYEELIHAVARVQGMDTGEASDTSH